MTTNTQQIVIWDKYVRLFHWSVATLFLLDFWVLEGGDPPHNWVGYAIGFLLIGRILWGFIGSHNSLSRKAGMADCRLRASRHGLLRHRLARFFTPTHVRRRSP